MTRVGVLGLCIAACGAAPSAPSRAPIAASAPATDIASTACTAIGASAPLDDRICERCVADVEPTVHPSIDWLALEIVDPGPLRTGEVHAIEVHVTNVGDDAQRIVLGHRFVGVSLLYPDGSGASVDGDETAECASPIEIVLAPGGGLVLHAQLSLLHGGYECSELHKNCVPSFEPVGPGNYEIDLHLDMRRVAVPAGPSDYVRARRPVTIVAR
jgi:hypothetical protein